VRLRTIRRAAERVTTQRRTEEEQRLRDARRREAYMTAGAPDKKAAVDLVGVDFGFKDDDGCVLLPHQW
jgi:hypothetical protein